MVVVAAVFFVLFLFFVLLVFVVVDEEEDDEDDEDDFAFIMLFVMLSLLLVSSLGIPPLLRFTFGSWCCVLCRVSSENDMASVSFIIRIALSPGNRFQ